MDWLILIVLVPAIIVPVVLLFGFAGCAALLDLDSVTYSSKSAAPFNLHATAISTSEIRLTWQHNSAAGVMFHVSRLKLRIGEAWVADGSPVSQPPFDSVLLEEGMDYAYQVTATVGQSAPSDPSNIVTAKTLEWMTAYREALMTNGGGLTGACLVQRIDRALLKFAGRKVRITLQGSTASTLAIQRIYLSRAVPAAGIPGNPAPNLWDSNVDLTPIVTGGITLPANTSIMLPETDYALTNSEDLVIAFDIASGAGRNLATGVGASATYIRTGAAEAATQNRSPNGWATTNSRVSLVERIEVLTG